MTGVLDKEQTLTTLKIRKLFNQLVFATEKGFPYFKLQKNSNVDVDKAIASFYRSRLYQELSDEKSKLWHYIIKDFQMQKWQRSLKHMVFLDILQSILNHCIQWEIVILCRILMIISVGWLCRSGLIQTQDSIIWRKKGYGRDRKQ